MNNPLRIGIVGWATRTGLGSMNADMFDLGFADSWLAVQHPKLGVEECVLSRPQAVSVVGTRAGKALGKFLDDLQIVVFAERPVLDDIDLVAECRRRGILTCCIPMLEWLPMPDQRAWVQQTDVMWVTSQWCGRIMADLAAKYRRRRYVCHWEHAIIGQRWGVNLARFPFTPRTRCERFLFANGFGGAHQRRGASVVQQIAKLLPQARFVVLSQRDNLPEMPSNCEVLTENFETAARIYQDGDIFLAPSRWEGLGLTLYEAQACGLPLATTDGSPMDEARPLIKLPCTTSQVTMRFDVITSHEVVPARAAQILSEWVGADISAASQHARQQIVKDYSLQTTLENVRAELTKRYRLREPYRTRR